MTDTLTHAAFVSAVKFDDNGLVPAIAQSKATGEVLMMAWMTSETLERPWPPARSPTGRARARRSGRKGETSGHHQRLVEAYVDCDGDVLLLKVDQMGPACHTGAPSCFFRKLG